MGFKNIKQIKFASLTTFYTALNLKIKSLQSPPLRRFRVSWTKNSLTRWQPSNSKREPTYRKESINLRPRQNKKKLTLKLRLKWSNLMKLTMDSSLFATKELKVCVFSKRIYLNFSLTKPSQLQPWQIQSFYQSKKSKAFWAQSWNLTLIILWDKYLTRQELAVVLSTMLTKNL